MIDFDDFISLFSISFPNTSTFVKNTPLRVVFSTFNSLFGAWKCDETLSVVRLIYYKKRPEVPYVAQLGIISKRIYLPHPKCLLKGAMSSHFREVQNHLQIDESLKIIVY